MHGSSQRLLGLSPYCVRERARLPPLNQAEVSWVYSYRAVVAPRWRR
jgi:hypothetical protein